MMWHFYEIPYIPDLELVKYQSLGEQGIDGILERHNRFLRQWQRNTVLIHTTLHFFLSYTHERPKGSRLQIFLAFSSDQTVNFESIDALMQASPLADYYKIAPIEDVPVCLRKSFTNILLVKKQEQTRLSTGDTLFTVEGWKSNPKSRLYEMEKTAEALNEDMVYHISIYGSDTYKTAQQALQKPIAILREKALGRSGQITLADNKNRPRDVSAEETLRIYEEFLSDVAKSPCFFANIIGISDSSLGVLYTLLDAEAPCSQYDLCSEWSIPKQTINTAVAALQKKGVAFLSPIPGTRNKKNIAFTEFGRDFAEKTVGILRMAELDALAELSPEERELYIRLNEKYNCRLIEKLYRIMDEVNQDRRDCE